MLGALAACSESAPPTASTPAPAGRPARRSIADGANAGNAHFYFLPPMVAQPQYAGTSDGTLAPIVRVCEWDANIGACGGIVAQFVRGTSSPAGSITYDPAGELYHVNWNTTECTTGACTLDPATTYRLRVLVGSVELGHADLDVVSNGTELRNVETGEYIGLLDGRTLPVKFRIEQGAVKIAPRGEPMTMATKGGTLLTADGKVALKFPEGALAVETDITVTTVQEPMIGVGAWAEAVDLGPDGSTFAQPVTLTLGFDARKLPAGVAPSALAVVTWTGTGWRVVEGSSVNETDNTVSAPISHFSIYSVYIMPNLVTGNPPGILYVGQTTQLTGFIVAYEVQATTYCYDVMDWETGLVSTFCETVPYFYSYYPDGLEIGWSPLTTHGLTAGFTSRYSTVGPNGALESPPLEGLSEGAAYLQAEIWTNEGWQVPWFASIKVLWPVHSVTVSPSNAVLSPVAPGNTAQMTASVRNVLGEELHGRHIAWKSEDPMVASVDDNGVVTAHETGRVKIFAASGGVIGSAVVTVAPSTYTVAFGSGSAEACCTHDIFFQQSDGSGRTNITNLPKSSEIRPRFSADGRWMVFESNRDGQDEIYIRELHDTDGDGIHEKNVTQHGAVDAGGSFDSMGKRIVFTSNRYAGNYDLWLIDFGSDPLKPTRLTTDPLGDGTGAFSPDGNQIAFVRGSSEIGYDVWILDLTKLGTPDAERRLTAIAGFTFGPRWSPDGSKLVFGRHQDGIYILDVPQLGEKPVSFGDARLVKISPPGMAADYPDWSPDGRKITWSVYGEWNIYMANTDGSDLQRITGAEPYQESYPSFVPFYIPPSR